VHMKGVLAKVDADERYVFHDGLRPMNTPYEHRLRRVEGDHLITICLF
jgi:hypothetical protein